MKITVVTLMLVAGCSVGPEYERPEAPAVDRYTRQPLAEETASVEVAGGEAQRFLSNRDISHRWWRAFESPELNALIERALKASPTLEAATAALRQAQELASAQRGYYFPTVQGSLSPSVQRTSAFVSPTPNSGVQLFRLYTAQLSVGYSLDVWGGNRRQVEALMAAADVQRFQLEAAAVTLATNLAAAVVQEAALREQIEATRQIIEVATKSLDLLKRQLEAGAVTGLDVAAQEAALAQAQQALPPLQKQLEQVRDLIRALAGEYPSDHPDEEFRLAALHLPQEIPVSLPSKIVDQRPDVRAAEAQLRSASAQIGVAVAKLLPQFSINGSVGGMSDDYGTVFSPENAFWNLAGNLTHTLFDGGTLLHQKRAAEWAFVQAAAQYKGAVIAAFQNVADTLYALHADAEGLKAAVAAEQAAKKTLDITLKRQQAGQVNYLALLSAQQAYQQALIARVQAQAARFADTAALFQALGGGWWNRPE